MTNLGQFPSLDPTTGKLRPEHVPVSVDGASKDDLEKFSKEIELIDGVFWAGAGAPTPTWIAAVRAAGKTPLDLKQVRRGDRINSASKNAAYELILDVVRFDPLTGAQTVSTINVGNVRGEVGQAAYDLAVSQGFSGTKAQWIESLKGRDGSNVLPTDQAIASSITSPGIVADAFNNTLNGRVGDIWATTTRYPTLDPTGVNNSYAAIQQAIRDTPSGSTLYLRGKFYIDGNVTFTNVDASGNRKSLSMDWSGAEIVSNSSTSPFTFFDNAPAHIPTSNQQIVDITMENGLVIKGTAFTVADVSIANGWLRGDIVKVIANNSIPGSEPGTGTNETRVGEWLPFHSVSGSTIILIGTLIDSFTDNVRLCKYNENINIYMKCGKIRFSDTIMNDKSPRNVLVLRNLVNATIDNLTIQASSGAMISNEGCYKTTVTNANMNYGIDNPGRPGGGNYSYGLVDKASAYTRMINPHGRNLRHLYTDDTSAIAADSLATHAYGGTFFAKIIDGSGQGSSASMFDVHHASYGVEFINCSARDSYFGFQLRGRMGRLINPRASFCVVGGRAFEQSIGGETYDSTIVNWESDNCKTDFEFTLRVPGHPLAEQRQDKWFVVDGFTTRNTGYRGINLRNASLKISNVSFQAAPTMETGGCVMTMRNSRVSVSGSIDYDFSSNSAGTGLNVIELNSFGFSVFESGPGRYRHPLTGGATRVGALISSSGSDLVRVREQSLSQAPAIIIGGTPVTGSYVDWSSEANSRSSAGVLLGTSSMADSAALSAISRTMKASVTAFINPSGGGGSLAAFPVPQFDGQRLIVVHYGTANQISISHNTGTSARRYLFDESNKLLNPGQSISFVSIPGGYWKQVTVVS